MSPIKDTSIYPDDWPEIRERILRRAAETDDFWPIYGAGDEDPPIPRCECTGECGWHWDQDEGRCLELHGSKAQQFRGDVVLTIAHLDHDASAGNHEDDNLKAMCQGCHLAFDRVYKKLHPQKEQLFDLEHYG